MKHGIAVVVTDGMGRDVLETVQRMVESAGVRCEWEVVRAGHGVMVESGTPLPDYVLKCIKRNSVGFKLSFTLPGDAGGIMDLNAALRRKLKLYANVCHYLNLNSHRRNLDVLTVSENQEGSLGVSEHKLGKDVVQCTSLVTRKAAERISRLAFDIAGRFQRRRVILVHQTNQARLSDSLYLETFRVAATEHPRVEASDILLEHLAEHLTERPISADLLLVPPYYASVTASLCRALAGQRELSYEANLGDGIGLFESNGNLQQGEPLAVVKSALMAGQMLLRYIGEWDAADELVRSTVDISRNERSFSRVGSNRLNTGALGRETRGVIRDFS